VVGLVHQQLAAAQHLEFEVRISGEAQCLRRLQRQARSDEEDPMSSRSSARRSCSSGGAISGGVRALLDSCARADAA
jgi:hypothetical protein